MSRRDALKALGVAGAAAAVPDTSFAQESCSFTLKAETAAGPSAPLALDGVLQFSLENDGNLAGASFTSNQGPPRPVVGRATGRAIDFQIELSSGETIAFSGVGDQPISNCQGSAAGLFSGPQSGDLGGWQVIADTAQSAPVLGSSSQSSSAGSSLGCPPPQTACGQNCCPGGAVCTDANQGLCVCSAGTVQCGVNCVPDCPSGRTLDLDTCTCLGECLPEQSGCNADSDCCGGRCTSGICFTCPGLECGDLGCIDHLTDPFNCGACGEVCVDDTGFCLGGVCQCIPDNEPVGSSSSSCCAQRYVQPTGLCGCAKLGEWCEAGDCCDGAQCVADGTGFKTCCWLDGHSCTSDTECCFSVGYEPGRACINGVCAVKP